MLISIEGIDGAGKNTLVSALKESLDRPVEVIAFPRYADSIHAQLAQKALYGKMGDLTDSAYAMATLFALDRYGVKDQLQRAKNLTLWCSWIVTWLPMRRIRRRGSKMMR